MSKPASTADWDTGLVNVIPPTSGHKASGYTNDEVPTAAEWNQQFNTIGLWIAYLNAGAMDGAFTFDSTIDCTTGYRGASGGVALFPAGLSATTLHFTTPTTRTIPTTCSTDSPTAGGGTTHTRAMNKWTCAGSATPIYYPLDWLNAGDTITAYAIDFTKVDTGNAAQAFVVRWDATEHGLSSGSNSGTSAGLVNLGESGLAIVVADGYQYYLKIVPSTTTSPGADHFQDVTVSYHT